MVRLASFRADVGHAEARRLLERSRRPSAIIAGGSALLPGGIRAARELGLAIPHYVSVVAGADSDVAQAAQLASPPFTVVRWSHDELGKGGRSLPHGAAGPAVAAAPASELS